MKLIPFNLLRVRSSLRRTSKSSRMRSTAWEKYSSKSRKRAMMMVVWCFSVSTAIQTDWCVTCTVSIWIPVDFFSSSSFHMDHRNKPHQPTGRVMFVLLLLSRWCNFLLALSGNKGNQDQNVYDNLAWMAHHYAILAVSLDICLAIHTDGVVEAEVSILRPLHSDHSTYSIVFVHLNPSRLMNAKQIWLFTILSRWRCSQWNSGSWGRVKLRWILNDSKRRSIASW